MRQRAIRKQIAAGFTLIELMIVVSIIGILAATALPAFQSYVNRSRANDGRMMVEVIKLRQEAYRSEFGLYVTAGLAPPATLSRLDYIPWVGNAGWTGLGFAPPAGQTRFKFEAVAGPPQAGAPMQMAGNDFWYYASAHADFDGDGNLLTFTGFSEADFIFCNQTKGWE